VRHRRLSRFILGFAHATFLVAFMATFMAAAAPARADQPLDNWYKPKLGADWLSEELVAEIFPGAMRVEPLDGTPPAAEVYRDGVLAGYVFITRDAVKSVGFSLRPFTIAVGLSLDGNLTGAKVVGHQEPIIDLIMLHDLVPRFISQYGGLDVRQSWRVSLTTVEDKGSLDGISSATISAILFNEAIFGAARVVARARGLRLNDEPAVNLMAYTPVSFDTLVANGSISRMVVTRDQVAAQGVDNPIEDGLGTIKNLYAPRLLQGRKRSKAVKHDPNLVIDLYAAPAIPPTLGRNLMGDTWYNLFVGGRSPKSLAVLLMSVGPYGLGGTKHTAAGAFDRLRVIQDGKTFELRRERFRYFAFLHGDDKPVFSEIGLFWVPEETGIDPLREWEIELSVFDEDGAGEALFRLPHQLDARYILEPSGVETVGDTVEPIWMASWRAQKTNIAILVFTLAVLTAILVMMEPLTRRPRLFRAIRNAFLLFVLVWMGWMVGAQVTVINVLTWLNAAITDFSIDVFMIDPLILIVMVFSLITFVVWGRGIFCGWLCPFGALQELLAKVAQALRVPRIELSHRTHKLLWPVKYVALAILVGISLNSMTAASTASEVEPFKTAISLMFARDWPYVLYAVAVLAIGLFVERAFCRFLCPLGAAMAIGGKLRVFNPLKRRDECGTPCHLCERHCPIQAIEPSGKINMTECFYCLDCQIVYYDEHACPPLAQDRKRRQRAAEGVPVADPVPAE